MEHLGSVNWHLRKSYNMYMYTVTLARAPKLNTKFYPTASSETHGRLVGTTRIKPSTIIGAKKVYNTVTLLSKNFVAPIIILGLLRAVLISHP